jgi:hypothetical protein
MFGSNFGTFKPPPPPPPAVDTFYQLGGDPDALFITAVLVNSGYRIHVITRDDNHLTQVVWAKKAEDIKRYADGTVVTPVMTSETIYTLGDVLLIDLYDGGYIVRGHYYLWSIPNE